MADRAGRGAGTQARRNPGRSALITFSGVEGGGKTTSSRLVQQLLSERGVRCDWCEFIGLGASTRALRLWHRLRGTRPRARDFEAIARSEPRAPGGARRRRRALADARRIASHVLDVLLVRLHLWRCARRGVEVVVFDRYFYDALVRWNLSERWTRRLERIVPAPDLAFLVQADPEAVVQRRGRGASEVARLRAAGYRLAAERHPRWVRLPCEDPEETRRLLAERLDAWLAGTGTHHGEPAYPVGV